MKKKIIKALSLLLLCAIVISATACTAITDSNDALYNFNGSNNHSGLTNIATTSQKFIDNSYVYYKITSDGNVSSALSEFKTLFTAATGLSMPDSGRSYELYLGLTSSAKSKKSSLEGTDGFGTKGYRIKTDSSSKNVYIYGNTADAVRQGVYGFMDLMFGYDTYAYNVTTFTNKYTSGSVYMKSFDVKDIPDISFTYGDGTTGDNALTFSKRMGLNLSRNDSFIIPYSSRTYNDVGYSDSDYETYSSYIAAHSNMTTYMNSFSGYSSSISSTNCSDIMRGSNDEPEYYYKRATYAAISGTYAQIGLYNGQYQVANWYSSQTEGYWLNNGWAINGGQWCYTAHGNADQYKIMTTEVAKIVGASLINNVGKESTRYNLVIMQEDNTDFCHCQACISNREKYGSDSGSMCIFFNDVMKIVKEYYADYLDNYTINEFKLIFNPYSTSITPPTTKNANGDYIPVNEKVVLDDGIGLYVAYNLLGNIEVNRKSIEGWSSILNSDRILFWDYPNTGYAATPKFSDYSGTGYSANGFYKVGNYYNQYYSALANLGVSSIFQQTHCGKYGGTNFIDLRNYLYTKLAWDCNRYTADELMNRYFTQVYKYDSVISNMKSAYNELKMGYEENITAYTSSGWTTHLANALTYINNAKNALTGKSDADAIKYQIIKEELAVLYTQYKNNSTTYAENQTEVSNYLATYTEFKSFYRAENVLLNTSW